MADNKLDEKPVMLIAEERKIVIAALSLSMKSLERAIRTEPNEAVVGLREKQLAQVEALVLRFR